MKQLIYTSSPGAGAPYSLRCDNMMDLIVLSKWGAIAALFRIMVTSVVYLCITYQLGLAS